MNHCWQTNRQKSKRSTFVLSQDPQESLPHRGVDYSANWNLSCIFSPNAWDHGGKLVQTFPWTIDQPFTSSTVSRGLKQDSHQYLSHSVRIKEYWDFQMAFCWHHPDPWAVPQSSTWENLVDAQDGHWSNTAKTGYAPEKDGPQGILPWIITSYERTSNWWHHITGRPFLVTNAIWVF